MSSLQVDLLARCEWLWQDDNAIADPSERGEFEFLRHLAAGASNFQCEKRWRAIGSIAAGATETLDLQALALTSGGVSGTISFATIKLIVFKLTTDIAGVKLGGTVANEWFAPWQAAGRGQECGAGSPAILADLYDGWAVSAGAKGLLLTNLSGANQADYQIAIFGN